MADDINFINPSDWALSFVAIWDQHLTAEGMQTASDALMEYLATGRSPVAAAIDATPSSNTVTTISEPSTVTTTTMGPCNATTITIASNATTTTSTTIVSCPELDSLSRLGCFHMTNGLPPVLSE